MSLKQKFIKNSFFNVAGWVWVTILNLISIPIVIRYIGIEQYGILAIVFSILGYFAFLDLGLGEAVVKFVSEYKAKDNADKINRVINSILFVFLCIGVVGGLLIALLTKMYGVSLFDISEKYAGSAVICFYLTAVGFFLNLVMGVIQKIPEGLQRFDITSKVTMIIGTWINLGNIAVVMLGGELLALVIWNLCGTVIAITLNLIFSKKILPTLRIDLNFSQDDFKEVFSFGLFTLFSKLASVMSNSLYQLIIGAILGPASVAIYNVPGKVISRLQGLIHKISYVVFPMVSELKAGNDLSRLVHIYHKVSRYTFYIAAIFFISVIAFSYKLLQYWINVEFADQGYHVLMLLSLAYFLHTISMVPSLVVIGMGKPKYNAIFAMVNGIISIGLLFPFAYKWGVVGTAVAFLVASLNVPIFIVVINKKILNISSIRYFMDVFLHGTLASLLLGCFYAFILNNIIVNLWSFFAVFILSLCISSVVFFFHIEAKDRNYILAKFGFMRKAIA